MCWGVTLVCWCCTFKPFLFGFIHLFSLWFSLYPCGLVLSHTESHIFPHHYCSALTCLPLPYLSVTTYSSGGVMFPSWHLLLLVLQPNNQGRRERLPHCFSFGRKAEKYMWALTGNEITLVFKTCNHFQWQHHRNSPPSFRPPPPPLPAGELVLAGSLLSSSCVGC